MNEKKFKWKCDICGTRFNNFQAEGFNRKIYCPLCFFKELNRQKEQQLQAYKDKEKEIRRICKAQKRVANTFIKAEKDFIYHNTIGEDILQILNEGEIE